ncbi:MAG: DUF262 domain-containing protein [Bryobacteraceae bacterium]
MKFELTELRGSTVWNIYRMRDRIQLDPDYQRMSDIWTLDKRQLLIDTVLNDFDIPKLYLHKFNEPLKRDGKSYDYAIIDGKQRLETLWAFIDGKIALPPDFEYFKDPKTKAGDMTYSELGQKYPDLKAQFDGFQLNAVCIETDDLEMIEEMFSRLNESAPLTAPEKRNAYGGPLPAAIRKLAAEPFFRAKLPFPNKRYRHFDVATKFLLAEKEKKVVDTKKVYLDKFVEDHAGKSRTMMPSFLKQATENVARMAKVFTQRDSLLRQVGMVTVYYHLFRIAEQQGWTGKITRKSLADFEHVRAANREKAEKNITKANYDLIEFDRYAQSPNDGYAIKFRLSVLLREVFGKKLSTDDL